jgi:hypothetical protein
LAKVKGQDIRGLEEPRFEDDHIQYFEACILEEGVVGAQIAKGGSEEVARRWWPGRQCGVHMNIIAEGREREVGIVE